MDSIIKNGDNYYMVILGDERRSVIKRERDGGIFLVVNYSPKREEWTSSNYYGVGQNAIICAVADLNTPQTNDIGRISAISTLLKNSEYIDVIKGIFAFEEEDLYNELSEEEIDEFYYNYVTNDDFCGLGFKSLYENIMELEI